MQIPATGRVVFRRSKTHSTGSGCPGDGEQVWIRQKDTNLVTVYLPLRGTGYTIPHPLLKDVHIGDDHTRRASQNKPAYIDGDLHIDVVQLPGTLMVHNAMGAVKVRMSDGSCWMSRDMGYSWFKTANSCPPDIDHSNNQNAQKHKWKLTNSQVIHAGRRLQLPVYKPMKKPPTPKYSPVVNTSAQRTNIQETGRVFPYTASGVLSNRKFQMDLPVKAEGGIAVKSADDITFGNEGSHTTLAQHMKSSLDKLGEYITGITSENQDRIDRLTAD